MPWLQTTQIGPPQVYSYIVYRIKVGQSLDMNPFAFSSDAIFPDAFLDSDFFLLFYDLFQRKIVVTHFLLSKQILILSEGGFLCSCTSVFTRLFIDYYSYHDQIKKIYLDNKQMHMNKNAHIFALKKACSSFARIL